MGKVIIGIHGLSNKPPKQELTDGWRAALDEGMLKNTGTQPDFTFKMVYWADLLHKHPQHRDPNYDFDALYNYEPYLPAETKLETYSASLFDRVRIGGSAVLGSAFDVAKNGLGITRVADWVLERTLKDLDYYYSEDRLIPDRNTPPTRRPARDVIIEELRNALEEHSGDEIMLLSHSMGTIIAFDALHAMAMDNPDFELPHFITMGAPLGLPHLKTQIIEEAGPEKARDALKTPPNVTKSWVNYWDRGDAVALDGHLSDDFERNANGVKVVDDLVSNSYVNERGDKNVHKSYGYLRTPELSSKIEEFLDG